MSRSEATAGEAALDLPTVDGEMLDELVGLLRALGSATELGGLRRPRKDSRNVGWRNTRVSRCVI
jgi:hypothetical protein